MFGMSFEDIVARIAEERQISEEDIRNKVKEKMKKLPGLISNEGAAHIVANELGVDVYELIRKKGIKINKIIPGMRGVGAVGKVIRINDVKAYSKDGREGKIGSLVIGDETGAMRVVLWDVNQIKLIEDKKINVGDVVRLTNGYVKQGMFKEMHLSNRSDIIINPAGVTIDTAVGQMEINYGKRQIKDLKEGEFSNVYGAVVQVFEPRFFEACAECGRKVNSSCEIHPGSGNVFIPVLNFVVDDGTGNIRSVVFRENVGNMLGLKNEEVDSLRNDMTKFNDFKINALGKYVSLYGKVNKWMQDGSLEFSVNKVEEVNPADIVREEINSI